VHSNRVSNKMWKDPTLREFWKLARRAVSCELQPLRQISRAALPVARELPRAELWREYTSERDAFRRTRRDAMATQQTSERSRRTDIKQTFIVARDAARAILSRARPAGVRWCRSPE
jgi:hypothetical protein